MAGIDDSIEDDSKVAMVRGYWDVGQLSMGYKESTGMLIKEVAQILEISDKDLQKYTQFYKTFPEGYPEKYHNRVVNWSMIRSVLPVHDAKARDFYLRESCRHDWNKYELTRRIKENYYYELQVAGNNNKRPSITEKEQRLYTYAGEVMKVVDGDSVPRKAAYEMRDGPSESTCRSRLQSALSGNGQNLLS